MVTPPYSRGRPQMSADGEGAAGGGEGVPGGAGGIRTRDLLHAMQAFSQLNYSPT